MHDENMKGRKCEMKKRNNEKGRMGEKKGQKN